MSPYGGNLVSIKFGDLIAMRHIWYNLLYNPYLFKGPWLIQVTFSDEESVALLQEMLIVLVQNCYSVAVITALYHSLLV